MTRRPFSARCLWHTLSALIASLALFAETAVAAPTDLDGSLREEVRSVHIGGFLAGASLEVTIFRPPGDGPFPILLFNHGKNPGPPDKQGRDRPLRFAREFVRRGFAVVVPMRRGFSKSGGSFPDVGCDLTALAAVDAADMEALLAELAHEAWVDPGTVVVAGQSAGGVVSMAMARQVAPNLKAVINVAGGLKSEACPAWQKDLVQTFGRFGEGAKVPTLWFYGAEDKLFPPELVNQMETAFAKGGTRPEVVRFDSLRYDDHGMIGTIEGAGVWEPAVSVLLTSLGIDFRLKYSMDLRELMGRQKPSGYAAVDNLTALPASITSTCRSNYAALLHQPEPRAFALSASSGACGAAYGRTDAAVAAMDDCEFEANGRCAMYLLDDAVVWTPPSP